MGFAAVRGGARQTGERWSAEKVPLTPQQARHHLSTHRKALR
jgi:hypothetical protein